MSPARGAQPSEVSPVTTTVTRRVKPGHEAAYEEFLERIIAAERLPRLPRRRRVPSRRSRRQYRIVYRFDRADHLRGWLDYDEHAAWVERAEPHAAGPTRTQFATGLDTWFTLPARPGATAPPPYKMALLTRITIFPLITGVVIVLGP